MTLAQAVMRWQAWATLARATGTASARAWRDEARRAVEATIEVGR